MAEIRVSEMGINIYLKNRGDELGINMHFVSGVLSISARVIKARVADL